MQPSGVFFIPCDWIYNMCFSLVLVWLMSLLSSSRNAWSRFRHHCIKTYRPWKKPHDPINRSTKESRSKTLSGFQKRKHCWSAREVFEKKEISWRGKDSHFELNNWIHMRRSKKKEQWTATSDTAHAKLLGNSAIAMRKWRRPWVIAEEQIIGLKQKSANII